MKKVYTAPYAEKIVFNYAEQVVAASGACTDTYIQSSQGESVSSSCGGVYAFSPF